MGLVDADDRVGIACSEVIEQAITWRVIDNDAFFYFGLDMFHNRIYAS